MKYISAKFSNEKQTKVKSNDTYVQLTIKILFWLFLVGATCSYYILYGTKGVLLEGLNPKEPDMEWMRLLVVRYLLGILRDAMVLWMLAAVFKKMRYVSDAMHDWLMLIWGGFGIILFSLLIRQPVDKDTVYHQLLIITQGAFPLAIGVLAVILLASPIKRWIQREGALTGLMLLLWLPLVFNRDLFLFNVGDDAMSVTAVLFLGLLACGVTSQPQKRIVWRLLLPIIGILSLFLMAIIDYYGGISIDGVSRFVGLMSPLSLFPAMLIARWATAGLSTESHIKLETFGSTVSFFILLLLGTNGYAVFAQKLFLLIKLRFSTIGLWWLPIAIAAFLSLAIVVTLFGLLACSMPLWQAMTRHWQCSLGEGLAKLADWRPLVRRLWADYHRPLIAVFGLLAVQLVSSLMMNQSLIVTDNIWQADRTLNIFSFTFGQLFARQLIGALILLAAYWVLLALTNRFWVSFLSVAAASLLFAFANRIKINLRSEPIVVSDLSELKQLPELLGMINLWMVIVALVVILALVVLVIFVEKHTSNAGQPLTTRLGKFGIAMVFILSLGSLNHTNSLTREAFNIFGVNMMNINPVRYAQWHGPVLQFLTGLDTEVMAQPKGYSKQAVTEIVNKYRRKAAAENKSRVNTTENTTIIFNLSESFADPTRLSQLSLSGDPVPAIHALEKETTSGSMLSFSYGGGTANIEWMTLTGTSLGTFDTTLNTPYTQLVSGMKTAPNVGNSFGYASAIHPYSGGFYNRPAVYRKFDFDKFAYLGSDYKIYDQKKLESSPYLSDSTAYSNALRQIKSKDSGQFINLITIQNHLPFSGWYGKNQYTVNEKQEGVINDRAAVETYVQGLHYTDEAVKNFRESLDQLDKPIIWVFYGDHLPGLYNTFGNGLEQYKTTYFVYANRYAREHGALGKQSNTEYVGPNDFIALAVNQGQIKETPYAALLSEVQKELPAQWMKQDNSREDSTLGTSFVTNDGKRISYQQLTSKQKELYRDYQLISYDLYAGEQYALGAGLTKQ